MIKFSRSNEKYGCFSNFYPCSVEYGGIVYPIQNVHGNHLKHWIWRRERNLQHIRRLVPRKWEDGLSFVRTGKK